jgi:hypothetical protein
MTTGNLGYKKGFLKKRKQKQLKERKNKTDSSKSFFSRKKK